MHPLKSLYNNKPEYEAIQKFLNEHLDALAVKYVFKNKPVTGLHEAKITLQEAFGQLEREYGHKTKKKPVNQSE